MEAPATDAFVIDRLTSFRRLLRDVNIDSDISARFWTEHDISVIHDLALCLQVTENRYRRLLSVSSCS